MWRSTPALLFVLPLFGIPFAHAADQGRTWGEESTVAYDAEIAGEGFVEPVMALCSDGDVLCVMRTNGYLPLMQARSSDGGKTGGKPTPTGSLGVDPDTGRFASE